MDCQAYYNYYYSYIEKDFQAIPPKSLEHLRSCPICRRQIEQLEQSLVLSTDAPSPASYESLALQFRLLDQAVDCTCVKPFLPCLAMASLPIYCRTPVTAHLEACPACRADYEKVLALQMTEGELLRASRFLMRDERPGEGFSEQAERVLSSIRVRPNSGVLTTAALSGQNDADTLRVATLRSAGSPETMRSRRMWRLAAPGLAAAAAAMALFAALLFVGTPSAGALDLHQFYGALAGAQNLSIQTLAPEEDAYVQQLWVSQTQGLRLIETPEKTVLYDLNAKTMTLRDNELLTTTVRVVESFPNDLQLPWGLLPFKDVTQISEGFEWRQINSMSDGQIVVYELTWKEMLTGRYSLEKRWVGYIDRATYLPERIEWYERFVDQSSYRLLTTMEIIYPKTEAVLEAVHRSGLSSVQGSQR